MNNYGFIDDGHYGLNKEQMAKLAESRDGSLIR